jgi:hypothetical protein
MSAERYLIGDATLDLSQGCLRRNGVDVALRPKSFALLHYLVIHAGRLVSKDELLSKISIRRARKRYGLISSMCDVPSCCRRKTRSSHGLQARSMSNSFGPRPGA